MQSFINSRDETKQSRVVELVINGVYRMDMYERRWSACMKCARTETIFEASFGSDIRSASGNCTANFPMRKCHLPLVLAHYIDGIVK